MSTSAMATVREQSAIGRPFKFQTLEELETGIETYFQQRDEQKRPYTMAGLARALDISRQTLISYESRSPGFLDAVRKARARVEEWTEEGLWGKYHPAGPIFSLKNNFGWKDVQEVDVHHTLIAIGQPGGALPQSLEPPCIDVTPIAQIANENGVSPPCGTDTFASEASLSPVSLSDCVVENLPK